MRLIRFSRFVLSNVCIICSLALLTVCVLDWFNPYMDFLGHTFFVVYILCFSSIVLGVETVILEKQETPDGIGIKKKKRNDRKYSERRRVRC